MKVRVHLRTIILSLALLFLSFEVLTLHRRVIDLRKSFRQRLKKYKKLERANFFLISKAMVNRLSFPKELKEIPFADENLILGVKEVEIRNVFAPYNPALVSTKDGYSLLFRFDKIRQLYTGIFNTYLGHVNLDRDFNQTAEEYTTIDMQSLHAEDPRVICANDQLYLLYNDVLSKSRRGMHIAKLDLESRKIHTVIPLDLKISLIEKNWAPFVYSANGSAENIYFQYKIASPRKLLQLGPDLLSSSFEKGLAHECIWSDKWGGISGGTPALLVDGEYLAFFHSKFVDALGIFWYVMGAYTFEAHPPFKLTAISPHPILFEGIYDSAHLNTADPMKCVIFPSGLVTEQQGTQTLLHLACGENDSSCKIITFDKDELLKSLKKIKTDGT